MSFSNPTAELIAHFLRDIGIEVLSTTIQKETFLPGIEVDRGRLLVDESRLKFPGDLLHEAGHLAVAPAQIRSSLSGEVNLPDANMHTIESQAMTWSYAAARYLELDPEIVFHEHGYRGKSQSLLQNFSLGIFFGLDGLVAAGMTAVGQRAAELGVPPFPHMLKWMRD